MAQGDVISGTSSLAVNAVLDIRPASGVEWSVHNLYWGGAVELYRTDGTISIKFDSDGAQGARLGASFNCTNTQWIQIKNTAAASTPVGYDGRQTK